MRIGLQDVDVLRSLNANGHDPGSGDDYIRARHPVQRSHVGLRSFQSSLCPTLLSSLDYADNDDVFDNLLLGGGARQIQQQAMLVERREMELLAAKHFLKPGFDAVATYRNNGFGDDLTSAGPGRFAGAMALFLSIF